MKKIRKIFGAGLSAVLLLNSCSAPINSGIITEKRYEPRIEYFPIEFSPVKISQRIVSKKSVDDEDYIIIFSKKEKGKIRTRKVYVSKKVYDSLKVGDVFDTSKFPYEDFDRDSRGEF